MLIHRSCLHGVKFLSNINCQCTVCWCYFAWTVSLLACTNGLPGTLPTYFTLTSLGVLVSSIQLKDRPSERPSFNPMFSMTMETSSNFWSSTYHWKGGTVPIRPQSLEEHKTMMVSRCSIPLYSHPHRPIDSGHPLSL